MSDKDRPAPTEQHMLIAQTLLKESDRGCAILAAALLSENLEVLLRSFFRQNASDHKRAIDPLFSNYAPLATFAARLHVAYALGILPRRMRDRIEIVRRLRNDFADEWGPIDFAETRCRDRLNLLHSLDAGS